MTGPTATRRLSTRPLFAVLLLAACEGSAAAQVVVQPLQINFNVLPVGNTSLPSDITIQNVGGAPVVFQSVTLSGANPTQFKFNDPGQFTLAAAQAKVVTVTYAPVSAGAHSAVVVITPAGMAAAQVRLSGSAIQPVLQLSTGQFPSNVLDFDQLGGFVYQVGIESDAVPVGLKVPSNGIALSIDRITVDPSADFRVTPARKPDLAPGQQTLFDVYFTPSTAGLRTATASVFAKGVNFALATVTFKGTGVGAPPVADMTIRATDLATQGSADLSTSSPDGSPPEPSSSGCSLGAHAPAHSPLVTLAVLLTALLLRRRNPNRTGTHGT